MTELVIAKTSRGEPLKRILFEAGERVMYLANPERIAAVKAGETEPVGFPREDVFVFDDEIYAVLAEEWASQRATQATTWERLRRYRLRSSEG